MALLPARAGPTNSRMRSKPLRRKTPRRSTAPGLGCRGARGTGRRPAPGGRRAWWWSWFAGPRRDQRAEVGDSPRPDHQVRWPRPGWDRVESCECRVEVVLDAEGSRRLGVVVADRADAAGDES